eukprot:13737120-Alexandrium_andersonii.AAC.1
MAARSTAGTGRSQLGARPSISSALIGVPLNSAPGWRKPARTAWMRPSPGRWATTGSSPFKRPRLRTACSPGRAATPTGK